MAHHVFFVKAHRLDVVHVLEDPDSLDKTGLLALGQVDLRDVARHHHFGIESQARQEHLHLFRRRVLRLVENDEAVVERAAAHVRQRRDLDAAAFLLLLEVLRAEHVEQRVVQRAQVRVDLLLQVAGLLCKKFKIKLCYICRSTKVILFSYFVCNFSKVSNLLTVTFYNGSLIRMKE